MHAKPCSPPWAVQKSEPLLASRGALGFTHEFERLEGRDEDRKDRKCITFLPVVSWYGCLLRQTPKPEIFDFLHKIQTDHHIAKFFIMVAKWLFQFDKPLTFIVSPLAFLENVQTANGWEVGRTVESSTWRPHPTTITVSKKRNWLQQSTLGRTQCTKDELQVTPGAEEEGAPQPPPSPSPSPDAIRLQEGVPSRLPRLHQPQVGKPA